MMGFEFPFHLSIYLLHLQRIFYKVWTNYYYLSFIHHHITNYSFNYFHLFLLSCLIYSSNCLILYFFISKLSPFLSQFFWAFHNFDSTLTSKPLSNTFTLNRYYLNTIRSSLFCEVFPYNWSVVWTNFKVINFCQDARIQLF